MISPTPRIGYILKRYPRYSETFIVNEILAHEAQGLSLDIFALRPTIDTHFQDLLAQVHASVTYCLANSVKISDFWQAVEAASQIYPNIWSKLAYAQGEDPREIYQALCIAGHVHHRQITHLHAHFATSATGVARLVSLFTGIPYSFTAHAKDIFHESVNPRDLQQKLADAHHVITVSDFNLNYLQHGYGEAAQRVQRIYNGLDLVRFPFQCPEHRRPLIVAVGRLVEKKGFADLITACLLLKQRGCVFECHIVGTGELEMDLRSQIASAQLEDSVQLIGPRPQAQLREIIQSAAVFAAPCILGSDGNRDGLPTVLLEAMALGTPCVSTDVTGIPELVRDRQTGLLVSQGNPPALARALEELLSNENLGLTLAENARSLLEQEFDIHRNTLKQRQLLGWQSDPTHSARQEVEV